MNLHPIFAQALTPDLEAKLTPGAIQVIQGMNEKYEGRPAYIVDALKLGFVYDNGGGRRVGIKFDFMCLDPSNDWTQSVYLFEKLMNVARSIPSQKLIKITSVEELEEMEARGEIDFIVQSSGSGCSRVLEYFKSGKTVKWESGALLEYLDNPGYHYLDLIVKLDNGKLVSLGNPGNLPQAGTDPTYGPIYTVTASYMEMARAWARPIREAIEHPRVVFVYWGSDPRAKKMSPGELLQYLNSLPPPEQPGEVQSAQTAIPSSSGISSVAEPGATTSSSLGGTFISSDWAWCVTRFPNDPARQQQCLTELQRKVDTEVPKSVIIGAGASAGTIALLLLAFGALYLLLKGR
ncbi:MAG: hypothetical protein QXS54_05825 [Candidatus Methanomethylicaceae archaeon]